ncbi:MAG: G5 domain-containing protein [Chloroflexi bacterium]|nr:G5 domain-containing protein [Chloroflexota bacterium]
MKNILSFTLAVFVLAGCQPFTRSVTILDGERQVVINTREDAPFAILEQAGVDMQPGDRILVNGMPHGLSDAVAFDGDLQIQVLRSVAIRLVTPSGEQKIQTSAPTVNDVLRENGISADTYDEVIPPLTAPIADAMTITFTPAQTLTVISGDATFTIHAAARTVGEALAEAGIPLMGLDTSFPSENEALPADGQIHVTRVRESILVEFESLPFSIEERESADVAFGQREILQSGMNGTAIVRTRIRYENGVEVKRTEEEKSVMKEPVPQIVANGSKIALSPAGGDAPYPYWYAEQMYATWYSPCNSGTGSCSYGTASGARAGYGIVAVDYSIYPYLAGMRVYIPGYGVATIGDTGGGPIIETAFGVARTQWIDLGYDDNNIGGLTGWVTVYFLEPAPAEIPYFFQ